MRSSPVSTVLADVTIRTELTLGETDAVLDCVTEPDKLALAETEGLAEADGLVLALRVPVLLALAAILADLELDGETDEVGKALREDDAVAEGVAEGLSVGPTLSASVATFSVCMVALLEVELEMPTMTTNSDPDGMTRATLMLLHKRGVLAPGVRPTVVLVPIVVPPVTTALWTETVVVSELQATT